MTKAIITNATLSPTITKATLSSAIQTAMQNAGFPPPIDTIASNPDSLIYSYQFNTSAKGTVYLRINISDTLAVQQLMGDSWNVSSHTGTNFLGQAAIAATASATLRLMSVNHDECRLVVLVGAGLNASLGYIRPALKESFWNENSHLFCFNPWVSAFSGRGNVCQSNPFNFTNASSANDFRVNEYMVDVAPDNSRRGGKTPVYTGISSPARLIVGTFSSDVAIAPGINMTPGEKHQVQVGIEEYTVVTTNNNVTSAISIRTL